MSVSVNPEHRSEIDDRDCLQASNELNASEKVNMASKIQNRHVRLRVVSVKVWGQDKRLIETYAFLDEGSDTTLCTEQLLDKLQVKGQRVQYSLATVNGMEVRAGRQADLNIQRVGEQAVIQLPNVISVPALPELHSSIPNGKDCNIYSEVFEGVVFPNFQGGVEILIGADVPGAHRTIEYRINHSGGPNAVKCALGWTLLGAVNRPGCSDGPDASHINFVQTDNVALHGLMQKMYEKDFVDKDDGVGLKHLLRIEGLYV